MILRFTPRWLADAIRVCSLVVDLAVLPIVVADEDAPTNTTTGTSTTAVTTTTTTTFDVCNAADTACSCASYPTCWWAQMANGAGRCQKVVGGVGGGVDCSLCPEQPFCVDYMCSRLTDACACAEYPQSCSWGAANVCERRIDFYSPGVACNVCPSQAYCETFYPTVQSYSPQQGEILYSGSMVVTLTFSTNMVWCAGSDPSAFLWCDGSLEKSWLPQSRLTVEGRRLRLDISEAVQAFSRGNERECGIVVPGGQICDAQEGAEFPGLTQGRYSFKLQDNEDPSVVEFDPRNSGVEIPASRPVRMTFSEPVVLGDSSLTGSLSRLSEDRTGTYVSQSSIFNIAAPTVTVDGAVISFNLENRVTRGALHTFSLPPGAVLDLTGNQYPGLAASTYTFRVEAAVALEHTVPTSSNAIVIVLVVVFIVLMVLGAVIGLRYLLLNAKGWRYLNMDLGRQHPTGRPKTASRTFTMPRGQVESDVGNGPSWIFSKAKSAVGSTAAQPATWSASARVHPEEYPTYIHRENNTDSSPRPSESPKVQQEKEQQQDQPSYRGQGTSAGVSGWNKNPGTAAAASNPAPARARPGNFAQAPGRGSAAGAAAAQGWGPSSKSSAAPPTQEVKRPTPSSQKNNVPPEVQAVQRQLQNTMSEPLAIRKKILKDLMLEYHPDKNRKASATEVFQYINNAKHWFLHES